MFKHIIPRSECSTVQNNEQILVTLQNPNYYAGVIAKWSFKKYHIRVAFILQSYQWVLFSGRSWVISNKGIVRDIKYSYYENDSLGYAVLVLFPWQQGVWEGAGEFSAKLSSKLKVKEWPIVARLDSEQVLCFRYIGSWKKFFTRLKNYSRLFGCVTGAVWLVKIWNVWNKPRKAWTAISCIAFVSQVSIIHDIQSYA